MLKALGVQNADWLVGKFNINNFNGTDYSQYQLPEKIDKAFNGIIQYSLSVPVPLHESQTSPSIFEEREFANVCIFPISDIDGSINQVGILFFPHSIITGDPDVIKCREWIDRHWKEPFDYDEVARYCSLSKNHLSKIFKSAFGLTPFQYYRKVKIVYLKIQLADGKISIKEAFNACGLDYNGSVVKVFTQEVGISPSDYRKKIRERKQALF